MIVSARTRSDPKKDLASGRPLDGPMELTRMARIIHTEQERCVGDGIGGGRVLALYGCTAQVAWRRVPAGEVSGQICTRRTAVDPTLHIAVAGSPKSRANAVVVRRVLTHHEDTRRVSPQRYEGPRSAA